MISLAASDSPSSLEKTNQLERILLSPTFKRSPKLSKLLQTLVERDLTDEPIDEDILGVLVFDRPKNWIPMDDAVVREGMRRLRKLLESYYGSEGFEDRLNLEIDGYKPSFSYNIRNPFERQYRRALRHIGSDPKMAFSLLGSALSIEPNHAGAIAAWAEAELWRPLYGYDISLPALLASVEATALRSLRYDPAWWRAHVVMGALHCCRRKWKQAADSFGSASTHSPGETRAHPWYAAFLMATGRTEDAVDLAKARANAPSQAPWPQLTYVVFLYAARQFIEAKRLLLEILKEHEDNWLAHVLWACLRMARQETRPNPPGFGMWNPPHLSEGALVYPALSILCNIQGLEPDYPDYSLVKDAMEEMARKKLAGWEPPSDADRRPYAGDFCLSPCQLACGYMAIGDADKAIAFLDQDLERGHPLMAWLHLWPILDPLREEARFKQLIRRMKLPSRS